MMKKCLIRLALSVLLFGVVAAGAAYIWLPTLIQQQAATAVQRALGRKLSIEYVRINPLNLSVELRHAVLYEPDGVTPFVSVAGLKGQISWASVRRLAPVVNYADIDTVQVNIVRTGRSQFNFSDIVQKLAARPPSEPAQFALYNLSLSHSRVDFNDRVTQQQHRVSEMSLALPFISNLAHDVKVFVTPKFEADVNGTAVRLAGKTLPFDGSHESVLTFDIEPVALAPLLAYSPVKLPFTLLSGNASLRNASLAFKQGESPQLILNAQAFQVTDLKLAQAGSTTAVMGFTSLAAEQLSLAPLARSFAAKRVALGAPYVKALADAQGQLNVQRLFAFPTASVAAQSAASAKTVDTPWSVSLGLFESQDGALSWQDDRYTPALTVRANQLRLSVPDVQWPLLANGSLNAGLKGVAAIGQTRFPAAAFSLDGVLNSQNAVTAQVQVNAFALDTLAPVLLHQQLNLDVSGLASLQATLNYSAKGELSSPTAQLKLSQTRLALAQSAAPLLIEKASLQLKNSQWLPVQNLNLQAELNFADQAYAKANGSLKVGADTPLQAALKVDVSQVDALPIMAFVPQALRHLNVRPASGFVSALGDLSVNAGAMQWQGAAALDAVRVLDMDAQEVFKVGKLSANQMRIDTAAPTARVHLGAVVLQDAFTKLLLSEQGKLNIASLVKPSTSATPASTVPAPALTPHAALHLSLDGVTVLNTAIDFTDHFIKPNYHAHLSQLTGTLGPMSSLNPQPADVALKGKVEGSGDLTVSGTLNLLAAMLYTDISARATGIELTPLSPYAAKYADYNIVKGKLSAQVSYLIDQGKLTASNKIKIDQLTFGEQKMGSADATQLPVKLAVALLKDRKGVIEVDLPITGSLNDPKFSVGSLIWQVLGNLLVKAVTSPFALIGSVFGGGETLSYLEFASGSAVIDAMGQKKLDSLAQALNDRPALKLDMTGRASADFDLEGLRLAWLQTQLRSAKLKALLKQNKSLNEAAVTLSTEDEVTYLPAAYNDATFSKPSNLLGISKSLPASEMRKLMLTQAPVNADSLAALAAQRAQTVQAYLQAKVDKEQLFVVQSSSNAAPTQGKPARVDFSLK